MPDTGVLETGTLTGNIELIDHFTSVATSIESKIDTLNSKYDSLIAKNNQTHDSAKNAETGFIDFGDQLERVGERIGAYFTIDAIKDFAEETYDAGEKIKNLSLETGLTTDQVQQLNLVFEQFGVSGDQVARILFNIQERVAGGDESVAAGFAAMGLSLDQVKNMDPMELLNTISDGLGNMSKSEQDVVAKELGLGRIGPIFTAMAGNLRELTDAAKSNPVFDPKEVNNLADQREAWRLMGNDAKVALGSMVPFLTQIATHLPFVHELGMALDLESQKVEASAKATEHGAAAIKQLTESEKAKQITDALTAAADKELSQAQKDYLDTLTKLNLLTPQYAAALGVTPLQLKKYTEESKAAAQATKEYNDAWDRLHGLGTSVQDTLNHMTLAYQELLTTELKEGASEKDLETVFGATATQVKALTDQIKMLNDAKKEGQKVDDDTAKLNRDTQKNKDSIGATDLDKQMSSINDKMTDQKAKIEDQIKTWADLHDGMSMPADLYNKLMAQMAAIDANTQSQVQDAMVGNASILSDTKESLDEEYQKQKDVYDAMLTDGKTYSADVIQAQRDAVQKAKDDMMDWRDKTAAAAQGSADSVKSASESEKQSLAQVAAAANAATQALNEVGGASTYDLTTAAGIRQFLAFNPNARVNDASKVMQLASSGKTLQQIVDMGLISMGGDLGGLNHYAGGTDYAEGGTAVVGEHGPEVMRVPRGAKITSHEKSYGLTIHVPVTVVGGIIDPQTMDKLSDHVTKKVSDAMGIAAMNA